MRRRATYLIVAMLAALLLASGVAIAANVTCKSGSTATKPCKGTPDPDIITGTGGNDYINSLASDDVIDARAGDDTLNGGDGADALYGKDGKDTIKGGPGNDNYKKQFTQAQDDPNGPTVDPNPPFGAGLRGARGDDTLDGEAGDDDLIGNAGNDTIDDSSSSNDLDRAFGGTENDIIKAHDGDVSDEVSCGEGQDEAWITVTYGTGTDEAGNLKIEDADEVYDCETVKVKDPQGNTVVLDDQSKLPQNQPTSASYDTTPPAEPTP